jgi:hypothetical protein
LVVRRAGGPLWLEADFGLVLRTVLAGYLDVNELSTQV